MQESEKGNGYSDEIGCLAYWYYQNRHFDDDIYTWTGDARVDRSDPWGWWDKVKPYTDIQIDIKVRNPEDGTITTYPPGSYPTRNNTTQTNKNQK